MKVGSLIVCCMALLMLAGCGKSKEAYEKSFKDSFKTSFVKSCTQSAVKGGLKEDQAKAKCDCVGTYLVGKYSSIELTKLSAATESTSSKQIFDEAVNSCK
jgi:hypothetical protein